jgi:hypothetical protein
MKGIVFTKFIEMVEESYSVDFADQMIEMANLPSGGVYTAVGTYDHRELVALLTTLSQLSGQSLPDLLHRYGNYLFGQFAKLYPHFFVDVHSSIEFVSRIEDVIHVEVKKLYPDAELPRFDVLEHTPDRLKIVYRSDRHLGDLAEGLLESCIVHFGESDQIALIRENLTSPETPVCFTLTRQIPQNV